MIKEQCEFYLSSDKAHGINHSNKIVRIRRHEICTLCCGAILQKLGEMILEEEMRQILR